MGQGCRLLTAQETATDHRGILSGQPIQGALWSPHDRRVESRRAIGTLAAYIQSLGVTFLRKTLVKEVLPRLNPSTKPAPLPLVGAKGTPAVDAIGLPEFWPRWRWI